MMLLEAKLCVGYYVKTPRGEYVISTTETWECCKPQPIPRQDAIKRMNKFNDKSFPQGKARLVKVYR
jgi:hypothetical protein